MLLKSSLVELPGRGVTRVWEHPGPPGAPTLMLAHGVTLTAALNWSFAMESLGRRFRVLAMDLCGHGESFPPVGRFSLEDCADDLAHLAKIAGVTQLIAVGYSMGGLIAQLLYHRHRSLVSGLVLCSTARNFRGSSFEKMAAMWLPAMITTTCWNPVYHAVGADILGSALIGEVSDQQTREWVRMQMRQTNMTTALSAIQAVSDFTSHQWAARIDVPTAVIVPSRDRVVHPLRQHKLAGAIPGAATYNFDGDHGAFLNDPETMNSILLVACQWVASGDQSGTRAVAT
jgi:3-oxoadipate enol-lactonase